MMNYTVSYALVRSRKYINCLIVSSLQCDPECILKLLPVAEQDIYPVAYLLISCVLCGLIFSQHQDFIIESPFNSGSILNYLFYSMHALGW